ncbi:hypothetical protein [Luteibacter yeojuensis]|uniref:Uncharacterized protein n=1 Tax=Luteibacter yeojuensis TaxID=345309 RepID=A0A7X5QS77_9GAMM|nr:hypothetical protein [Luteibacter yeojuensis]NID14337.1 hypothetical protein [Luteibacter yeojuensis]
MDPKELGSRSAFPMAMIEHTVNSPDLTKRERIAMAAMEGLLTLQTHDNPERIAQLAVQHADALLNELAKEST